MDGRWTALVARVRAYFGVDADWERVPDDSPRKRRTDLWVALGFLVAGSLGVELLRSIDSLGAQQDSWVWPHVAVALGTLPLIWRHRWPLLVAAGLSLHLFVFGLLMPAVAVSMPMQVVYFLALFTGVAWARDRQAMLGVVAGVVLLMFGWLAWQLAVGSGVEEAMSRGDEPLVHQGLFSPAGAYVVYTLLINVFYFGGAIIGGQAAWRAALQRDRLAAQARTIDAQAASLQRQAVVEERLRIARELHDVVAHHVSVIGIQAAAARRVLRRDPDAA
ncbi:MAG: histidine kinase dimerization/phosphoacceptor domain-containing protein, partial [Terrabacter sp.]|nr:histidine kinase dimerization/phosphoacceptor domain-containing protein [Terrabacter sp.]